MLASWFGRAGENGGRFHTFFEEEIVALFACKITNNKVRRREKEKIDVGPRGDLYTFYPC